MANYILKLKNDGIDYTKKDDKLLDYVEIDQNKKAIQLDEEGTRSIDLSLHKMSFHRKVYEPGSIDATIQISVDTSENMPTIQELNNMFMRKSVQLDAEGANIASGYYVHEVRPRYESANGTSMYVDLKIYSLDNLMRINKFSEAYLGRRLREYIVKEGIKDYGFTVDTFDNKVNTYAVDLSEDDVLLNLSYGDVEFTQPYLVQYNETFYDFLARVCNRCGEFMYFEDGKLHVGLHTDNKETKQKKLRNFNNNDYKKKFKSIAYKNITEDVLSVKDYAHDSLKYEKDGKYGNLDEEPKTKWYDKYSSFNVDQVEETGAFPETKATDGKPTKIYNDEVSNDEFFMPLYRNRFAGSVISNAITKNIGDIVSAGLDIISADNTFDRVLAVADHAIKIESTAAIKAAEINKGGNEIINTWADTDAEMGAPFADNDRNRWTTISYYSDIKCNEDSQERKMVSVDMGDAFENLRLGDVVTLPYDKENKYVIVEVEMDCEAIDSESDNGESTTTFSSGMNFYALPLKNGEGTSSGWNVNSDNNNIEYKVDGTLKCYPPLLKTGAFRQSEPQHAIVIDSDDPKNQGRVRVRFPWQRKVDFYSDKTLDSIKNTKKILESVSVDVTKIPKTDDKSSTEDKNNRKKSINEIKTANKLGKESDRIKGIKDEGEYKDGKNELNKEKEAIDKIKEKIDNLASKTDNEINNGLDEILDDIKTEKVRLEYEIKKESDKECIMLVAGTPWIRMVTPMATNGGGMYFKPEKGDEVLVEFENGNVERPYVVGTLYSKNVVIPDGERIIKSPNGHYIKIDDPKNITNLLGTMLPAFSFMKQWGLMPPTLNLNGDDVVSKLIKSLMGGITLSDGMNMCQIAISGHDRKITINSTIGDVEISSLTGITIKSSGNIKIEGQNIDISAGNRLTLNSGTNLCQNPKDTKSGITAGEMAESLVKRADQLIGGTFDLSLIRCIAEIILKPVNGTLQIKSHSFLKLEAGEGNAEIPVTSYKTKYLADTTINKGHNISGYQTLQYILSTIYSLESRLDQMITLHDAASQKLEELYRLKDGKIFGEDDGNLIKKPKDGDEFVKMCCGTWKKGQKMNKFTLWSAIKWHNYRRDHYDNKDALYNAYYAIREFYKFCVETVESFHQIEYLKTAFQLCLSDMANKTINAIAANAIAADAAYIAATNAADAADAAAAAADAATGMDIFDKHEVAAEAADRAAAAIATYLALSDKELPDSKIVNDVLNVLAVADGDSQLKLEDFLDVAKHNIAKKWDTSKDSIKTATKTLMHNLCLNVMKCEDDSKINSDNTLKKSGFKIHFTDDANPTSFTMADFINKFELVDRGGALGNTLGAALAGKLMKYLDEKLLTYSPEHEIWSSDAKPRILMSENSDTMLFKHDDYSADATTRGVTIEESRTTARLDKPLDLEVATRNLRELLKKIV